MRGLRATLEVEVGPGRGPAGRGRAERADDGPARRRGADLGRGHQLRAALRAPAGARGPPGVPRRSSSRSRTPRAPALGTGRFVTTRTDFVAVNGPLDPDAAGRPRGLGEPVATMRFRILKYRPHRHGAGAPPAPEPPSPGPRRRGRRSPRTTPSSSRGPAGTSCSSSAAPRAGRSATRRCRPAPVPVLRVGHGRGVRAGRVYSFVVVHYPQVPGVRLPAAHRPGRAGGGDPPGGRPGRRRPADVRIGMPVAVEFVDADEELTLPVFRPRPSGGLS